MRNGWEEDGETDIEEPNSNCFRADKQCALPERACELLRLNFQLESISRILSAKKFWLSKLCSRKCEFSNFEPIVWANSEPIHGHTYESYILNVRESPNESCICVECSEKLETFLRKNLDKHRALCANLTFSADGYVPAALSRAKG